MTEIDSLCTRSRLSQIFQRNENRHVLEVFHFLRNPTAIERVNSTRSHTHVVAQFLIVAAEPFFSSPTVVATLFHNINLLELILPDISAKETTPTVS